jgi:catechol 2,3-dioxygenase-like lactoylglutathione lyase family enzyme
MAREPLDALRLPIVAVQPRFEFAQTLLRRLLSEQGAPPRSSDPPTVRYFVSDIDSAVRFYVEHLGFEVELRPGPTLAMLYRGDLRLLLSAPSGHVLTDGSQPTPGGWNRILIRVDDLDITVLRLREAGVRFVDDVPRGVAVRQVLLEDPSGNPVELFEPAAGYHERERSAS